MEHEKRTRHWSRWSDRQRTRAGAPCGRLCGGGGLLPYPVEMAGAGPSEQIDILDGEGLVAVIRRHRIDTIFNLAALLSAEAEAMPLAGWNVGVNGLINVLEAARSEHCAVFTPSSIGAFGPESPHEATPQDTVMRPRTIYGITKVAGELLSDYYFCKYGVDTRSVRYPGLISHVTPPGGGTTDYAVDIYYSAVKGETFHRNAARKLATLVARGIAAKFGIRKGLRSFYRMIGMM